MKKQTYVVTERTFKVFKLIKAVAVIAGITGLIKSFSNIPDSVLPGFLIFLPVLSSTYPSGSPPGGITVRNLKKWRDVLFISLKRFGLRAKRSLGTGFRENHHMVLTNGANTLSLQNK